MADFKKIACLSLAGFLCLLPASVDAARGLQLRTSTKAISRAIGKNARQLVKPTFVIKSRYASAQNSVAVSPDGSVLATGGANGMIQLWDLGTGQRQKALDAGAAVSAAGFAEAKEMLVTGHEDGRIIFWDTASGRQTQVINQLPGPVAGLALTAAPEGASTGRGFVRKKSAESPPVSGHQPTEQYLVAPGENSSIVLLSLVDGSRIKVFDGHQGRVLSLAATRSGTLLASGDDKGTVLVWDWHEGTRRVVLDGLGAPVLALALSSDGSRLAAGLENGTVMAWSFPDGRELLRLKAHKDGVRGVIFSPDNENVVSAGADNLVRSWSLSSGSLVLEREGHWDQVNGISSLAGGRFMVTASSDKTVRFWSHSESGEIARLVAMQEGWAVVSPEGYFDGTLDGALEDRLDAVQWATGTRSFGVDNFLEHYYLPALLGRVLAGASRPADTDLPRIAEGFQLPPEVKITSPAPDSRLSARSAKVTVEASEQGGGIDEIRLYHNRKIVDDHDAVRKSLNPDKDNAKEIKEYTFDLVDGENILTATALSRDRIESEAAEIAVYHEGNARPPMLHLFAVGINSYKNPALDLNFGVPDAMGVEQYFSKADTFYRSVQSQRIFNTDATRDGILAGLDGLATIEPQDTLILYFAGHGDTIGDEWFFIPHDLTDARSEDAVRRLGISSMNFQQRLTRFKVNRILVLFDACKSGAALDAFTAFEDHRPFALLSRATGIHLAAAATGEQFANELQVLGHGLFTYALLEGLSGKADKPPGDGSISVLEALSFIREKMPLLTTEYRTFTQKPVINSRGLDFPLGQK